MEKEVSNTLLSTPPKWKVALLAGLNLRPKAVASLPISNNNSIVI